MKALTPSAAQVVRLTKACLAVDAAITHYYRERNDVDYALACGALAVLEGLRNTARLDLVAAESL